MTQSRSQRTRAAALTGALCFILTLIGVVFTPAQSAHAADNIVVDDIVYALDTPVAGQATATDYYRYGGAVTIPASVTSGSTTYTVTTIGTNAFSWNMLENVTIPNSVTTIGDYAFRENLLESVTFPNALTTIGEYAFVNNRLASVTIPDNVTTINEGAFQSNILTSVTIPDSVTTIGDRVFFLNQLSSVTIPNSVTTIGEYAFYWNLLESVTIPDSVTTIGDHAFGTNYLTSVTIPNSVTTIGNGAFQTNYLTSVTIPDSVTTIGDYAFHANQLESVTIPNSVTTIGAFAFYSNLLESVTIPNSVTTIGDYAFYSNLLESVTIPNSVTTIGAFAFYSNLLESVTIPNSVTTIGDYAFYINELTSVTIPNSVTTIGMAAFGSNTSLASVRFTGNAPTAFTPAPDYYASLGEDAEISIHYSCGATGFTTPTWQGYTNLLQDDCVVQFDTQGGSTLTPENITHGATLNTPTAPTRTGYTFNGWYTDNTGTTPYDFSTPVTSNLTLYAGWTLQNFTITFDPMNSTSPSTVQIPYGSTVTQATAPTRTGYTFNGWYTDNTGTTPYDFSTPVTSNLTLYAGWTAQQPVIPPTPDTPTPEAPAVSPETTHHAPALARTGTTDTTPVAGIALASLIAAAVLLITKRRETRNAHTPENN